MAEQNIQEHVLKTQGHRLTYDGPAQACLLPCHFPNTNEKSVFIKSLYSGISRGTESLVYGGNVPESEWQSMRCPHQFGDFSFPISYGYQIVGEVLAVGSAVSTLKSGDFVFTLHPHATHALVDEEMAHKLPVDLSPQRGVLSANMETALNAIWDSEAKKNDKVSVIGAGVVGLLTGYLAQKITGSSVTLIDIDERKKPIAEALGLSFTHPQDAKGNQTTIFHTSASAAGLQKALDLCEFEGRVIEMSWYGEKSVTLALGGAFHSKRLQIISSQVGHVSPTKRATTSYGARMAEAMKCLCDPKLDVLLEAPIEFKALPNHLDHIFTAESSILCQVVAYQSAQETGD